MHAYFRLDTVAVFARGVRRKRRRMDATSAGEQLLQRATEEQENLRTFSLAARRTRSY